MDRPTQEFTRKQLGWMRRWHSQSHLDTQLGSRPATQEEWSSFLGTIEGLIAKDRFRFNGLHWHSVRGKRALSTGLLEDSLVIRKINDNLRRSYGLSQPNRASLIRTAKQALRESTPKTIVRIDLKGCFESMCRGALLKRIRKDARVSTETMALLDTLFQQAANAFPGRMPDGVPRGLTISTSLAEIVLRELDTRIRMIPGVYLMLRYVDDLLVFSTSSVQSTWDSVAKAVRSEGLRLNYSKSSKIRVACSCEATCPHDSSCPCKGPCKCASIYGTELSTEYLGYRLIFGAHNSQKNAVFSILSERKTGRIKSRIHLALSDLRKSNDWLLLEKRVAYLTSNQKVAADPGMRGLFNGLSHTHSEYEEPDGATGSGTLKDLDSFYRAALRRAIASVKIAPINRAKLEAMSFRSGYDHHRRTKFTAQQVKLIQACWGE